MHPVRTATLRGAAVALVATLAACGGQASKSGGDRQERALAVCHSAIQERIGGTGIAFSEEATLPTNFGFKISGVATAQSTTGTTDRRTFVCSANENGVTWEAAEIAFNAS